jgi:heptosyltransferase I
MRILLVKLSSLGDVIHNFPVATDLASHFSGATIDWVTEAPYASLVAQHPAVRNVFSIHLRQLKRGWFRPSAWMTLFDDKAALARQRYDVILDTQGLVKSALVARWANGPIVGMDRDSAREPLAARIYDRAFTVTRNAHAVTRNRLLAGQAFGYTPPEACDYGLAAHPHAAKSTANTVVQDLVANQKYVVLLQATSRANKQWPVASWTALGRALNAQGFSVVIPAGNAAELAVSEAIAQSLDDARALPAQSLEDTSLLLSNAQAVIGVDTGLAHLAVALNRPTVGIYLTTAPARTGLFGDDQRVINLGGGAPQQPAIVAVDSVLRALQQLGVPAESRIVTP